MLGTGVDGVLGTGVGGVLGTGADGGLGTGVDGVLGTGVGGGLGTGVDRPYDFPIFKLHMACSLPLRCGSLVCRHDM